MMTTPESTSAEAFNQYLSGRLIAASNGWKNLLVRIYSEPRVEESVIYPAVAEPRIVRILSGAAAVEEAFQKDQGATHLRDVSGFKDNFLSALLEGLHKELSSRNRGSSLFVEGIAQSLAVHLVRTYVDEITQDHKGGLPGFRLRKVTDLMVTHLEDQFSLIRLAREAEMSEFHFSRAFKRTTGL